MSAGMVLSKAYRLRPPAKIMEKACYRDNELNREIAAADGRTRWENGRQALRPSLVTAHAYRHPAGFPGMPARTAFECGTGGSRKEERRNHLRLRLHPAREKCGQRARAFGAALKAHQYGRCGPPAAEGRLEFVWAAGTAGAGAGWGRD